MKKIIYILTLRFLQDSESIKNQYTISKKRTKLIFSYIFIGFFLWILIFNIGQMTILGKIRGENLSDIADKKYKVDRVLEPARGKIYDRNGYVLADNIESYKLIAVLSEKASEGITDPSKFKHVVDFEKTATELSKYIELDKDEILNVISRKNVYQVEFGVHGKDISIETKKKIEELNLPGIIFETTKKRYYPNGTMLGNFLGFAQSSGDNSDLIVGRLGIEKVFDYYLRGKSGRIIYARDAWGQIVSSTPKTEVQPINGADIYLTIDKNIQSFIDNSLADIQEKYDPESAFSIALSAKTGEILGIGQTPAFNPNTKENIEHSWTNAIYNSAIEPGSTFKIFSLALMIENGIYDPDKYYMSGSYRVKDAVIYDYNKVGWGTITYRHGFQESSNTLMLTMLEELGKDKLKVGLENFGFGKSTNSLYENESAGQLSFGDIVSASTTVFGQGSTVTPIQMVQAETAILNEGELLKPYYLSKIYDHTTNSNVNEGKREVIGKPISKETAEKVKEELYGVVNGKWALGGKKYQLEGYSVSGKTGTAQVVDPEKGGYYSSPYKVIHSFMGYAPSDNPEIIVYSAIKIPRKNVAQNYNNSVKELFNPIMTNTLDYLNVQKERLDGSNNYSQIINYEGHEINSAINSIYTFSKNIVLIGSGNNVIRQFPLENSYILPNDKIFLVTGNNKITVPNFKGWSKSDILKYKELSGLNIIIEGNGFVSNQSIKQGSIVKSGDELKVKLS
ncbi:penicillin-binding transpeptidase domain-containing protein [Gemelliphila palaticanis]|uniref:PASTA domain-containing protein n=1 Tax=Gemelliphila palaticanis TaxID=81950 RepID=A0ABX2T019_9BACL|nr:penicillin-binding transpeptidase domain-containing protein [Gemella palaticanis]MBF0715032.1 PASTA domain-containing protein [Gemella palaticanis]NYS46962.1 PASTA domain-containing protein [Gemella palaticanis]